MTVKLTIPERATLVPLLINVPGTNLHDADMFWEIAKRVEVLPGEITSEGFSPIGEIPMRVLDQEKDFEFSRAEYELVKRLFGRMVDSNQMKPAHIPLRRRFLAELLS